MSTIVSVRIEQKARTIKRILAKIEAETDVGYLEDLELMAEELAYDLLMAWRRLFKSILEEENETEVAIKILRKFNDAGRRSPPWQPGSTRGHRRPQDGADGNRRNRWLFDPDHDFYSTKTMGCLVELKYVLQCFCMKDPAPLPRLCEDLRNNPLLVRILGHNIEFEKFRDPLTLESPDFQEFKRNRRYLESGHIVPHAKDGKHDTKNATMMLRSSNRIQADYTIQEAVNGMATILRNHGFTVVAPESM